MKIFVTGASGFIGSAVVKELLSAGHEVIGLARSEQSAKLVSDLGAQVLKGGLENLNILKEGASMAEGVIHTAYGHDFSQFLKMAEQDKIAIEAMGNALEGTNKPIITTGGILGLPQTNGFVTEADASPDFPRGSEAATLALAAKGVNASIIRLSSSVHGIGDKGFVPFIIAQARKNGVSAYPNEGNIHWPAVHRLDAANLFRLAIEKGAKWVRYNAVDDQAIKLKEIAELISEKLNLPLTSVSGDEIKQHFEWMSMFIGLEGAATSYQTQKQLGWKPTQIGLLEDMKENYF